MEINENQWLKVCVICSKALKNTAFKKVGKKNKVDSANRTWGNFIPYKSDTSFTESLYNKKETEMSIHTPFNIMEIS